jgi:hypothetical protein
MMGFVPLASLPLRLYFATSQIALLSFWQY